MSQFLVWLSQKIITACKNKPYGWGRVLSTPAAMSVDNFINDFQFQASLKNHSIHNCPIKGDKVTAVKRSIFLWLGEQSKQMEDLIKGSTHTNGFRTSRMDREGNVYSCFAVYIVHTHTLKTNIAVLQIYICLCQTNTAAVTKMPLNFRNLQLTKKLFPNWHDKMNSYIKYN